MCVRSKFTSCPNQVHWAILGILNSLLFEIFTDLKSCSEYDFVKCLLLLLWQSLLPRGCCNIIPWTNTYMDTWRCNFLGLPSGTHIPAHVELYVCVDIVDPDENAENEAAFETPGLFDGYAFVVVSPLKLAEKGGCFSWKICNIIID